jgi:hypothetical protein
MGADENAAELVAAGKRDGEAGIYEVLTRIAKQAVASLDAALERCRKRLDAVSFEVDAADLDPGRIGKLPKRIALPSWNGLTTLPSG